MMGRYAALSRDELAKLVPELLLIGQLIDRSGMAWCISHFGREEMVQIAIEEWAGSSPLYTKRMQRALGFEGVDIITIFKGLQLDIGAPPQLPRLYVVGRNCNVEAALPPFEPYR